MYYILYATYYMVIVFGFLELPDLGAARLVGELSSSWERQALEAGGARPKAAFGMSHGRSSSKGDSNIGII